MFKSSSKKVSLLIPLIIAVTIGLAGGFVISKNQHQIPLLKNFVQSANQVEKNKYLAFLHEFQSVVQENYWNKIDEAGFVNLHVKAIEKLVAMPLGDQIQTYDDLDQKILETLDQYPEETTKKEFITQLSDLVLANLEPFGRSRLYSKQLEQELAEKVNNIDPDADHYGSLGVKEDAAPKEIEQAYEQQKQALEGDDSPEAQKKLAQVEMAHQTLSDENNRTRYDQAGVNPTMEWGLISPQIFYLKIKQFSPNTVQELLEVTQKVDEGSKLNTLFLDLRGNIGGAIDYLPYFLGPFIGNNQYAYQFIQQGEITDFKTKTGWLPTMNRYKKMVIFIDENVQSSGEVMASVLKKYNIGTLIGTTTMGWGTIERVFPLKHQLNETEEYSVFLVHHLTLRADGNSIQGNGVEPHININHPDWEQELADYYADSAIISAIEAQFTSLK